MNNSLKELLSQSMKDKVFKEHLELTETQLRITAAALELFAEKGYHATTTQSIAKGAGVTEKTLFKHFESKERLFENTVYPALIKLLEPQLLNKIKQSLEMKQLNLEEILTIIAKDRVEFMKENSELIKFILPEIIHRPNLRIVAEKIWIEYINPHLTKFIDNLKDENMLRRDIPTASILRMIVSMVASYSFTRTILSPDKDWDDEREIKVIVDILLNGLRKLENQGTENQGDGGTGLNIQN